MSTTELDEKALDDEALAALSASFETVPASKVVRWAVDTFGDDLVIAASFQDAVLVDVATRVRPDIEVVFIDTGDHFPETYETVERVRARYHLNLRVIRVPEPEIPFHVLDPVRCCSDAKVAALEEALRGRRAWMSGLRRAEAVTRADAPIVGRDRRGLVKINPLATWSDLDVSGYVATNGVPYNPLLDQGYPSIGCMPTTKPVEPGADPRSGRWAGSDKTECGLHE
ncbi:MAG TPA: phosphoadenylyl-sulfate reductase [Acidimicrobiales bacterium]|nr:phosphoadenylyl-sulfate reductase [Acidimicrobiales bacterium]